MSMVRRSTFSPFVFAVFENIYRSNITSINLLLRGNEYSSPIQGGTFGPSFSGGFRFRMTGSSLVKNGWLVVLRPTIQYKPQNFSAIPSTDASSNIKFACSAASYP